MPKPLFEFGDFAVYQTGNDDLSFEVGSLYEGASQEMPWGQVGLLMEALRSWMDNG